MPQTETAIEGLALAHRENTGGSRDPSVPHDYATIVQRGLWMEDREEELDGKMRINNHARLFINSNRSVALDRNQRAELLVRQLRHCFGNVVDGLSFLTCQGKNRMAAQLG